MKVFVRKCRCVFLVLFCLLLIPAGYAVKASAEEKRGETIKVGYFDYGGFIEKDDKGWFSGYGYDYLEEIANYTGWNYEFVYGTWNQLLRLLADGEIDLLCTAQYSPERAQLYDYAKYESGVEYAALYVSQDNQDVFYEDTESFDGLRIAFLTDSYQNGLFQEYAQEHGFSYTAFYYDSAADTGKALAAGDVDAVLTGSLRRTYHEKVVAKFSPDPFYFITTKGSLEVMDGINGAMEEIRTADVNFNAKLYDKYYGESVSSQLAFTREEASYIQGRPTLRMVCAGSWAPISYWERNSYMGIEKDIMEVVSEKSGIRFQYIQANDLDGAWEMLLDGKADFICGYPRLQLQEAKGKGLLLSKTYLEVPLTLTARQGLSLQEVKLLALPELYRSIYQDVLSPELFADVRTLYFPDLDSCLEAVAQGNADATLGNAYLMEQYLHDRRYEKLHTASANFTAYPLSIGVPQGEGLTLLSILNKSISQINSDDLHQIILGNTMKGSPVQFSEFARRYGYGVVLLVAVLLILVFMRSKRLTEKYAYVDPLTGGRNLTKFSLDAGKILRVGTRRNLMAVASLDFEKFKFINDLYGYDTGNQILRGAAEEIKGQLKAEEIFCRSSGDQYLLFLTGETQEEITARCEALMSRISHMQICKDKNCQITLCCGIYVMDKKENLAFNAAVDRASLARQSVKGQHKNSCANYDESMREKILREKEIEDQMAGALENGEFLVYFQPKYSLASTNVIGAEALVRWRKPDGAFIYPDMFIPIFENNGFIINLDLFVFREICKMLRKWLDEGKYPYPISVNLSRVHLYQTDFYTQYLRIMEQYQIPAYLIELELTENAIFDNQIQLISVMRAIKQAGLSISMDDFGSGYSSLNLLKDMPIDFLKLDREFFNVSADTDRGQKVIQCVVSMARQLGISVVSEGVETQEQVQFLQGIHCDIAQGFYFSRPIPLAEYEKLAFPNE